MFLYFSLLIGLPALLIIVGLWRILAWAKVVKTWNKAIGVVVGYYMRPGEYGHAARISEEMLPALAQQHLRNRRNRYDGITLYYSGVIQYQYGHQFHEMVHWTNSRDELPYAINEEVLLYVNPRQPAQVKVGDNITQLWLPFTLFIIGVLLSAGILFWGIQHDWTM